MCEWCGHEHDQAALCTQRPTWGRRGFLILFGAGIAGLAIAGVPTESKSVFASGMHGQEHVDRVLTDITLSWMKRLPRNSELPFAMFMPKRIDG